MGEGFEMKLIKLTKGQVAKVSDHRFDELNQYNWMATFEPRMEKYYAYRHSSWKDGKRKNIYMHRVIADAPTGMQVDHIDGDTLNNQDDNLRVCTHAQNHWNIGKTKANTNGYKGVSKTGNKWQATIHVNKEVLHLGKYKTIEEAARAYDEAAKKHHGDFAVLNFTP